jgi:hypothetical protein
MSHRFSYDNSLLNTEDIPPPSNNHGVFGVGVSPRARHPEDEDAVYHTQVHEVDSIIASDKLLREGQSDLSNL